MTVSHCNNRDTPFLCVTTWTPYSCAITDQKSPPPPPTSMFIDLISFLHPATEQVNGSDAGSID